MPPRLNRLLIATTIFCACLAMTACTVRTLNTGRSSASSEKITTAQVHYDFRLPPTATVKTYSSGGMQTARFMNEYDRVRAAAFIAQMQQVFAIGFRDRFPAYAAKYGLTISTTAPARIDVKITKVETACSGRCVTHFTLSGQLFNAAGVNLWHFDSKVGQATIYSDIDGQIFDTFANELLGAMQSDGVIGR